MGKKTSIWLAVLVLVTASLAWLIRTPSRPNVLDDFASCVAGSGAIFYGAFWCPHCQNQKTMFASSAKLLPYVECSTPDGRDQLQICAEKEVTGYPTWDFADGTRETGEISLERLSELTGCPLPKEASSS